MKKLYTLGYKGTDLAIEPIHMDVENHHERREARHQWLPATQSIPQGLPAA